MKKTILTKEQVEDIRKMYADGVYKTVIARKHNIAPITVDRVLDTPLYHHFKEIQKKQNLANKKCKQRVDGVYPNVVKEDTKKKDAVEWITKKYQKSTEFVTIKDIHSRYETFVIMERAEVSPISKNKFIAILKELGFEYCKEYNSFYIKKIESLLEDVYCLPYGRRAYQ